MNDDGVLWIGKMRFFKIEFSGGAPIHKEQQSHVHINAYHFEKPLFRSHGNSA